MSDPSDTPPSTGRTVSSVAFAKLGALLADSFDYKGFVDSVEKDRTFTSAQKTNIRDHFDPAREVAFDSNMPGYSLRSLVALGASVKLPAKGEELPEHTQEVLPASHEISQIWGDVWQQSLDHYGDKVERYEQKMDAKNPYRNYFTAYEGENKNYPKRLPTISIERGNDTINAYVYCPMIGGQVETVVTEGFVKHLSADEQRGVLLHEAQHALEPMLTNQEPSQFFGVLMPIIGQNTLNASNRHLERRADAHAARMGGAKELHSALTAIQSQGDAALTHSRSVMRHLHDNGFAFDTEKVTNKVMETRIAQDAESGRKTNTYTRIGEALDTKKLVRRDMEHANKVIAKSAQEAPDKGLGKVVGQLRETMQGLTATHPATEKRLANLERLAQADVSPKAPPPTPRNDEGNRNRGIER